jgi:nucleotide-binding universal stress UspA family protein
MSLTYIAAYDGSGAASNAVRFAVELARAEQAEVIAAHVHAPGERDAGAALLHDLDIDGVARKELVAGSPAHALHDLSVERGASLVSVGVTHHEHLGRLVHGSVGAKLLHGAPCPVAAVPADVAVDEIRMIGVAYDGGPEARRALECAERLARTLGAGLVLIGAYDLPIYAGPALATSWDVDPSMRDSFEQELHEAAARIAGIDVDVWSLLGPAGPTIAEASADVDLLVTGSRGYGPVRSVLLGGTSRHLVDHARCPVLVVPRTAGAEVDREPDGAVARG